MEWHWSSSTKSLDDTNRLVHQVIRNALLNPEDLVDFDSHRETKLIDKAISNLNDGWHETTVPILVPDGQSHPSSEDASIPVFIVPGLVHRSLTEIIKTIWSGPDSSDFQHVPFRQFWTRSKTGIEEQVIGELYTSEAFNEAYEELQRQPPEPDCQLERVVCGLMLYSDSTHLANFGDASLWPLYMYFGNQSKYVRNSPSSGSCHHVAYIPKVSISIIIALILPI